MPEVVFQVEQFLLDALRLSQSGQASRVVGNVSVKRVVFLHNVAGEVALLEQVFVRPSLGIVEDVVHLGLIGCKPLPAVGVIQPNNSV